MTRIAVYDETLDQKTLITGFQSISFTRRLNRPGSFDFTINANDQRAAEFEIGNIISISDDEHGVITRTRKLSTNDEASEILSVSGMELKDILSWRRTVPPSGDEKWTYTAQTSEAIVRDLIDNFFITCTEDTRNTISIVALDSSSGVGTAQDFSTRYKPLDQEVYKLLQADAIGLACNIDLTASKIKFKVYAGLDRTTSQSTNARAIFSLSKGTLRRVETRRSEDAYANVIIAGGDGDGVSRAIVEVPASNTISGWDRRVTFIDARDVETTDELTDRALAGLVDYAAEYAIDGDIYDDDRLAYDLGDIITIEDRDGNSQDVQVTAITKNYTVDGMTRKSVTFGKEPTEIGDAINDRLRALTNLITN